MGVYDRGVTGELPPHARRILLVPNGFGIVSRTTSACAENTERKLALAKGKTNYLRMRGEYLDDWRHLVGIEELPPHARRIP